MKRLLVRENDGLLAELAGSNVLLAFDFDGTLAPIVRDREDAAMRPRTAELFGRLCALYPCAVISGRSKADVSARLAGAEVKYVVGNHGLEAGGELGDFEREVTRARPLLAAALADQVGLDLEDKQYSLAVHYRHARHKRTAREVINRAVSRLPVPMRLVPGKLVVNVVPASAAHKGDALLTLWALAGTSAALYVGDDATDEDVFKLEQPGKLLTARVGASKTSHADYALRDQREIDALLARLVGLRAERARR
ncbi:MAG TPA: trehalose-phosphatase [Polyangia bacterium]|jgi:trehalose 6-phosphate phosphatase